MRKNLYNSLLIIQFQYFLKIRLLLLLCIGKKLMIKRNYDRLKIFLTILNALYCKLFSKITSTNTVYRTITPWYRKANYSNLF